MGASQVASIAGAVLRSLLLLGLVVVLAALLSALGHEKLAVMALTLGASAMMLRSAGKPFPLTRWTILLPALSGVCVLLAQLALLESLPLHSVLLSSAGAAGLAVGLALGALHGLQMRDGAPWARPTLLYVAVWSLTYVALQGSALLGLRRLVGWAAAANGFAVALMVGVAAMLLARSATARRGGGRSERAVGVVTTGTLVLLLASAGAVRADTALESAPKILKESDLPGGYVRTAHDRDFEARCRRFGIQMGERLGFSRPVDFAEEWFNFKDRTGSGFVQLQLHYAPTSAGAQKYLDSLIGVDRERWQDRYDHSERLGIGDSAFYRHQTHFGCAWIRVGKCAIVLRACLPHSGLVRVTSDRAWRAEFVPKNIAFGKRLAALVAKRVAAIRHTWPDAPATRPPVEPEPSPPPQREAPPADVPAPFNPFENVPTGPDGSEPRAPFNPFENVPGARAGAAPAARVDSLGPDARDLSDSAVPAGVLGAGLALLSGLAAVGAAAAAAGPSARVASGASATRVLSGEAARDWLQRNGYLDGDGNFRSGYREWADRLPSAGNPTDLRHIQYTSNDPDRIAPGVDVDIVVRDREVIAPSAPSAAPPAPPTPPVLPVPPSTTPRAVNAVREEDEPKRADPYETWRLEQEAHLSDLLAKRSSLRTRVEYLDDRITEYGIYHRNACANGWRRGVWNTAWLALTNLHLFGAPTVVRGAGARFLRYLASNAVSTTVKKGISLDDDRRKILVDEVVDVGIQAGEKWGLTEVEKAVGTRLAKEMAKPALREGAGRAAGRHAVQGFGPLFDAVAAGLEVREDMEAAAEIRARSADAWEARAHLRSELMDVQQELSATAKALGKHESCVDPSP